MKKIFFAILIVLIILAARKMIVDGARPEVVSAPKAADTEQISPQ